jgi:hypothetical protein
MGIKHSKVDGHIFWSTTRPQEPGEVYVGKRDSLLEDEGLGEVQEIIVANHPDYFRLPMKKELGVLAGQVLRVKRRTVEPCVCGIHHLANRSYGLIGKTNVVIIECMAKGFMVGTCDQADKP